MQHKLTHRILLALMLTLLVSQGAAGQSEGSRKPAALIGIAASEAPSGPRHISSIRSHNIPNGSRVTITSNEVLSDYGAYRNGDNFLVLIPGAELALTEISVKGTGFTSSKVESRGTNLAFSFRLEAGISPSISQISNRLEVTFSTNVSRAEAATPSDDVEPSNVNGVEVGSRANDLREGAPSSPAIVPEGPGTGASAATIPASPVSAPPESSGTESDSITEREVDLAVPESPAFTVLGVNPETVTRPTTPREFATSILNGVDQNGNFQTGLALDFVPFLTFFGDQTSLSSYRTNRMERFLARTQLSFATTKGTTDEDKATRLALGLRLTLWDKGDPRLDRLLDTCYAGAVNDPRLTSAALRTFPGETDEQRSIREKKRNEVLGEVVKVCNDLGRKRNWNASGWIVGLAPSWISKTGKTSDFSWNGGGFWTSLAYGFDDVSALKSNSQIILHARYRNNEIVPDADNAGQFFSQDSMYLGGRVRIAPGEEANSIFSLEGNYIRSRQNKGIYDSSSRYSLGLERKLADNIWFSLALGGQSGRADGNNQAFVLSSFKWGFSQKK